VSTRPWAAILTAAACALGCAEETDRAEAPRGPSPSDSTPLAKAEARLRPVSPGHIIDAIDVEALRREGLSDPIAQVVDSLMAHPELIPHEGELGGRMGFYSARGVHILNMSWVYAEFDDGHVQGRGIFRYTVQADSSLAFEVVHSEVD
jgi:hypothetical protein